MKKTKMGSTAFLFSGQGSQSPGMMLDLYEQSAAAKAVFDQADSILGRSISELCFHGTQEELNLTRNTQPCVLAAELSAYAALRANHISPDAVAGFSLGEFAALVVAGALKQEEAFRIIQIRADAMQNAVPHGKGAMAAVMKIDGEMLNTICREIDGYIEAVNYNCPGQVVVSGESAAVDEFIAIARARRIRAVRLPVSAPFHCKLMEPATNVLSLELQKISFRPARLPCYSNVDAKPYEKDSDIAAQLCLQAKSPVLWEQTLRNMYDDGIRVFVEIGPGSTLTSFVRKTLGEVAVFNVNSCETLRSFVEREM